VKRVRWRWMEEKACDGDRRMRLVGGRSTGGRKRVDDGGFG
jgi:hypothetical protein